jgi:hypothetical protein
MARGLGRPRNVRSEEQELLERIEAQIASCSEHEHRLARRRRVLQDAATQLRLGRKCQEVLARIQAQVPDAVREEAAPVTVPAIEGLRSRRRPTAERRDEDWLRRQLGGLDGPLPS